MKHLIYRANAHFAICHLHSITKYSWPQHFEMAARSIILKEKAVLLIASYDYKKKDIVYILIAISKP